MLRAHAMLALDEIAMLRRYAMRRVSPRCASAIHCTQLDTLIRRRAAAITLLRRYCQRRYAADAAPCDATITPDAIILLL